MLIENTADFAEDRTVLKAASVGTEMVTLSVIIPSYNTAEFVISAIGSALSQTYTSLEVIVVDDGSTDASVAQIMSIPDPRITCIHQQNKGLSAARNTGIRAARGRYIGLLDSDDIWYPRKAERQISELEADAAVGLVYSFSAYLDESGVPTGQFLTTTCENPRAIDLIRRNHLGNGSTPIIRKACFLRAGLFNENLRSCEDIEMWVRIAVKSGYQMRLVPEPLTGYRVRRGSLSMTAESMLPAVSRAVQCFKENLPDLPEADYNRAFAQLVRIVSRKAFSNGQIALSRRLLMTAWRKSRMLPLYDVRASVLFMLHGISLLCSESFCLKLYLIVRIITRRFYTMSGLRISPAQ